MSEAAGAPAENGRLETIDALVERLEGAGIAYCHWKSNNALARSYAGGTDLDLLVRRGDAARLEGVLGATGFRLVLAEPALPGVLDWYAHDTGCPKLVHAHVHHRLVVGDDLTKNYLLDIEDAVIDASAPLEAGGFPVPPFGLELVLLVVRLTLKHRTWDAMLAHRGGISASGLEELAYLRERATADEVGAALALLPRVSPSLYEACLRGLEPGASWWSRAATARRLVRALDADARRPAAVDVPLKLWRQVWSRVSRRPRRVKRLASGGAIVAVVGPDGAGKTTLVEGLRRWLRSGFLTVPAHMGKPPPALRTRAVRLLMLARAVFGRLVGRRSEGHGLVDALFAVCLARDRARAYVAARRAAASGAVVVCDRFPVPQIALMDGPRIRRWGDERSSFRQRLLEREERWYARIGEPDVLVVLRIDPEIAVARRHDEDSSYVRSRAQEVFAASWDGSKAHVIDAGLPAQEVLEAAQAHVWERL